MCMRLIKSQPTACIRKYNENLVERVARVLFRRNNCSLLQSQPYLVCHAFWPRHQLEILLRHSVLQAMLRPHRNTRIGG